MINYASQLKLDNGNRVAAFANLRFPHSPAVPPLRCWPPCASAFRTPHSAFCISPSAHSILNLLSSILDLWPLTPPRRHPPSSILIPNPHSLIPSESRHPPTSILHP